MSRAFPLYLARLISVLAMCSPAHALTFSEWQSVYFNAGQLANSSLIAPAADPDGDGLSNLAEYVFTGDPIFVDTGLAPQSGQSGDRLTLTYRERSDLSGTQVWLQGGDDLFHWATFNTVEEIARIIGSSFADITVRDPLPISSKRFLRLKLQMGFLPRLAPSPAAAKMASHYSVELRWNDPNGYEYGYAIDRKDPQTGNWSEIASLDPDVITYVDTSSNLNSGYTYRVRLLDDGEDTLVSEPFGPKDSDEDGIPDDLELGTSYAGIPGTYASSAYDRDTDHDGMPDLWELRNDLNPTNPIDATQDTDGDGVSNLDEYILGSDPNDFFNNVRPKIIVVSGQYQFASPGEFFLNPIIVKVYKPDGTPWANAPVTFSATGASGSYSTSNTSESPTFATLVVTADSQGTATVYWKAEASQ